MEDDAAGGIDDAVYDVEPPDLVEIAQPRSACLLAAGPPCHILGMFRDDQISKRTLVGVFCIQCSRPKRKEHDTQNLHNSPCFLIDRRLLFVFLSSFSFCREPSETRCAVPTSLRATCDMCALRGSLDLVSPRRSAAWPAYRLGRGSCTPVLSSLM